MISTQGGFKKHIRDDHNMWNYVYYSVYLDSIDTGDHNAIQKYVYDLVSQFSLSILRKNSCVVCIYYHSAMHIHHGLSQLIFYLIHIYPSYLYLFTNIQCHNTYTQYSLYP